MNQRASKKQHTGVPVRTWGAVWRTVVSGLATFSFLAVSLYIVHGIVLKLPHGAIRAAYSVIQPKYMVLSVLAVLVSYACLSFYDVLALRDIGKARPWRQTAPGAVLAIALSNAMGSGFLSGGQVRQHFYNTLGLDEHQSTAVRRLDGLTLLGGALGVLGISLFITREAFASLYTVPVIWVVLAAIMSGLVALALVWPLAGRVLKPVHTVLQPRSMVMRLCIGMIDWSAMALVFYLLLPAPSVSGFLLFIPVFTLASFLGTLSNLPAGLGVFDAIILLLFSQADTGAVVIALAGYRVFYFVFPLVVSAIVAAFTQGSVHARRLNVARRTLSRFVTSIAPQMFSLIGFGAGALMLAAAMTPAMRSHLEVLEQTFPLLVIEVSHFLASIIGALLLIVSAGLSRRLDGAWLMAVIMLAGGTVLTLLKGDGFGEAAVLGLALVLLWISKPSFYRKSSLMNMRLTPGWVFAIVVTVGATLWLGFFSFHHVEYRDSLWWSFSLNGDVPRFLRASAGVATLMVLYFAFWWLRPVQKNPAPAFDAHAMKQVQDILSHAEGSHAQANMALLGDKHFLFSASGKSFIMYGVWHRSWIALGGPVGKPDEWLDLIWVFREQTDAHGARPVFYSVHSDFLALAVEAGLNVQKIGETAIIPLADFSLQGAKRSRLRQSKRRAERENCHFDVIMPNDVDRNMKALRTISDQWLHHHQGTEKGFSLGRFEPDYIRQFPIAVVRQGDDIVAFANLLCTPEKKEIGIDLMRYGEHATAQVMDYLFIELALWGQAHGYGVLDLAMAPLAGLEQRHLAPWASRLGAFVYAYGSKFYGFAGLRQFKNKFSPCWKPVYIAAPAQVRLPFALGEVALITSGGMRGLFHRD